MEHPVPQNITSFEFHLVGDMTIRQFGYLAAGCTIAYIIFAVFFTTNPYLSIPAIAFFSLTGAAFAFLPLSDRPLDHWVRAFFQAVYSPTQGSWSLPSKTTITIADPIFKNRLQLYLSSLVATAPQTAELLTKNWGIKSESRVNEDIQPIPIKSNSSSDVQATVVMASNASTAIPTANELNKLVAMATDIQGLKGKISETERQINQLENTSNPTNALSGQQYQQIIGNLQNLLKQTEEIYQKTSKNAVPTQVTDTVVTAPIAKPMERLPMLTSSPNVVNGIVTDTAGNLLEGVIIIVHNKDGIPVRALKTNKLGQFTGATPLPDGDYNIIFEKDSWVFNAVSLNLIGEVLPAVKIYPKGVTHG